MDELTELLGRSLARLSSAAWYQINHPSTDRADEYRRANKQAQRVQQKFNDVKREERMKELLNG